MRKIISFLKEARAELGKVIWPPRRRAVRLTAAVVVITVVFAGFIGAVDYGLSHGVQSIIGASKQLPASKRPLKLPANQSNPQPSSK